MCGRYVMTMPNEAMAELFDAAIPNTPFPANENVCPTQAVPVALSEGGVRRVVPMRWGLVPHWAKGLSDGPPLINARAETVADKPAFRAAVRARRCVVPADGFYEWQKRGEAKQPWFIARADGAPMLMGGIWQSFQDTPTMAIVTVAAEGAMAALHARSPLILAPGDVPLWLGEVERKAAPLMRPTPAGALRAHAVDPAVGSNRASGPGLTAPLDTADPALQPRLL